MDFKGLYQRRRLHFLIPFSAIMAVAVVTAMMLPAQYRSTAKILIESVETPQSPMLPTLPTIQEDPLASARQIALTRDNLLKIVKALDVYPGTGEKVPDEDLVQRMRRDIEVQPLDSGTRGNVGLGQNTVPTAFKLSFVSTSPEMAAKVCQTLASLFLGENIKERASKARRSYHFLSAQLEELQSEILDTETLIAQFKEDHLLSLPQLMELNLREMENLQKEIEIHQLQLNTARDHKIFLEGQLATVKPTIQPFTSDQGRVLTLEDKLKSLRSQYVSIKATHSDKHPDVIRLGREIAALEESVEDSDKLRMMVDELDAARARLATLKKRYSPAHPDVQAATREIEAARKEIAEHKKRRAEIPAPEIKPDNPAYINLQTQVESSVLEIRNTLETIDKLRGKYQEYVDRLERMPQVESEFLAMQRHYLSLQGRHKEIFMRQQKARETMDMEQQQISDHFTLLEPPLVPAKPFKPNRLVLVILGFIAAFAAGWGTALAAENLDQKVHTPGDLAALTGLPVLGLVPYLVTKEEDERLQRRRRITKMAGAAALGLAIITIILMKLF